MGHAERQRNVPADSYGQFQLQWTVTPSLMLPHSPEWYGPNGHESLATDARALALSAGLNWQEFDYDIFLHRRLPGTFYSGAGNNRGRGVWLVEAGSRRATSTSHWCFRYPLT